MTRNQYRRPLGICSGSESHYPRVISRRDLAAAVAKSVARLPQEKASNPGLLTARGWRPAGAT